MVYESNEINLIKLQDGAQGTPGKPGEPGETLYTWVKYSKYADGTDLTDDPTDAVYIGIAYNKKEENESDIKTDYTWSKIKGEDGEDGTSVTITSTSITYQTSSSGTITPTGTWSTSVPTVSNGQYLWTKTVVTYSDGKSTTAYSVAYKGTDGENGISSYTHIRYSANADGSSFVETPSTETEYIGVYTGKSSTAPTSTSEYKWSKYVGDKGAPGATGNGINSITYYYATTTTQTAPSASSITSTSIPTLSATNKYLWQKEVIDYTDSSVADKTSVILLAVYGDTGATGTQGEPGIDLSQGKMLYTDPTFSIGTNSTALYNSASNGNVTWVRSEKSSDNPISDTSYEMVCTNTGASSPGHGGFRFGNPSRANAVFIYRIIAKIPTGRRIAFATNTIGDKSSIKWLTSTDGTGKFTEYILRVECGGTGTFKATGYFYLNGGDYGTTDAPLKWYVAYATCFDMTGTSDVMDLKKTVVDQGSTLNVLNNKIESKVWSTDITTAKNDVMADTDNKLKNYSTTSEMNSAITQKANEITSTVSSTYTTKTELNNLEIGGRNLIQYDNIVQFGAGTIDKSNLNSLGEIIRNDTSTNGGFRFDSKDCYEPSSNYVLSGYITILSGTVVNFRILNGGKIGSFISFEVDGVSYGNPFVANFTAINDILNDKNEHYFELKYKSAATISEDTGYQYTYFQPNSNNATAVAYKLSKFCLQKGDKATVWSPEPEYIQQQITVATQTADKFNWLVQSGTSATDFTLTDRMAELTAEIISLNGNVKVNGDMLVDGTITGDKLNMSDIFSQNISMSGKFNATSNGWIYPDTTDYQRITEICHGDTPTAEELKYYDLNNDGKISLIDRTILKMMLWGQMTLQDIIDTYGYEPQYSDISFQIIPSDSDGMMRATAIDPLGRYKENRITATSIYYNYAQIESLRSEASYLGDAKAESLEIGNCNIATYVTYRDYNIDVVAGYIYPDITWECPAGYEIVHAIPTIVDNTTSWNRFITITTQSVGNTGCRLVCYSSGAASITVRMNLTFRATT